MTYRVRRELYTNVVFDRYIRSIADDDGMFTDWMNRMASPSVQEEMIQLMANTVLRNVIQNVKGNVFCALMADETSGVRNKE